MNNATRIKAKAVIRYNRMDGQDVVYFKQGKRFFKMMDGKRIRPMAVSYEHFSQLCQKWTLSTNVTLIEEDEQLLYKGKPVAVRMDDFFVNPDHVSIA